jgi:Domain of unknown function (DUF4136)
MRLARLALVFAALLSLACAAVRVSTDYDDTVDFASLETYAWLDPPMREESRDEGGQSADPFSQNTLVDKRVREDVDAWLTAHGYRKAGENEPVDFLVRWDLLSQPVTRDSPVIVSGGFGHYGSGYGVGSGVGYSPANTYQEGTLILDVIDPGTQQLLWRGSGTSQSRDPHMKPERLHKSIGAILERFPPKPKAGS